MKISSIKALLRGYTRFEVNGRRFWLYARAEAEALELCATRLDVRFAGYRPGLGWRLILLRLSPGPRIYDLTAERWLDQA